MVYSLRQRPSRDVFSDIYRSNGWRGRESRSGSGSSLSETEALRQQLPSLLATLGASTLLDAPCGDFNWMCDVDLDGIMYFGIDIVPELIEQNRNRFGNAMRRFGVGDVVRSSLPDADVILCRDCLVHLSFEEAISALTNFRATGAKYLLTTTFPARTANYDKHTGGWRPLNLCVPPFNLPAPVRMLNEGCREAAGAYADKSLGLWRLADLDAWSS